MREGDSSTFVIVLLSGCVKVTALAQDGWMALLAVRVGGDLIGELSGLDGRPRSATVTTATEVSAQVIGATAFRVFLSNNAEVALAVGCIVSGKLRAANQRRIDFGGPVRTRLACVLLELAATCGRRTAEGIAIDVPLTQPELAGLVGGGESSVHKALAGFRRAGLLLNGYRRLVIVDPERLRLAAGATEPFP